MPSRRSRVGSASAFATPRRGEGGANPAQRDPVITAATAEDEARDHDVVPVLTNARVLIFASLAGTAGLRS